MTEVTKTVLGKFIEEQVSARQAAKAEIISKEIPDQTVLRFTFPLLEIKDGKPHTPGGERYRLQAAPVPGDNAMAAAWKVLVGTIKAVGRHTGELDNEDVLSGNWLYCPTPLSEEYPTGVIPFWTIKDGLGATDRLFAFYFDIAESGATAENPKKLSATLSFDRDGKDVISIEHDFPGLKSVVFYLPLLGDTPLPADPEDAVSKRPEGLEYNSNLGIVKP